MARMPPAPGMCWMTMLGLPGVLAEKRRERARVAGVTAARIGAEDPRDLAALVEVVAGAGRGRRESRERHHTQDNRPTHVISCGQRRARRGLVRGDVDQDPVAISHLMLAERTGAAKQTLQGLAFRSRHRRGCETRVVGRDALHVLLEGVDVLDLEADVIHPRRDDAGALV